MAYVAVCIVVFATMLSVGSRWIDFYTIFEAVLAWRKHVPTPYEPYPNLNPPTLSVVLAPLTLFSRSRALAVWIALNAATVAWSLWTTVRHRQIESTRLMWCFGALLASAPAITAWRTGQVTWLLLLFVTHAWLSADRSAIVSGCWLGVAVAFKPPFALFAILLPRRIASTAALVGATITAAMVWITGVQPWLDWLGLSRTVNWYAWPFNASLLSWPARWLSAGSARGLIEHWDWFKAHRVGFDQFPTPALVTIAVLLLLLVPLVLRARGDRRWVLAFLWSILASPLGWDYYLPVIVGPIIASWPDGRLARAAFVLTALPASLSSSLPGTAWLEASLAGAATLLAFAAWSSTGEPPVGAKAISHDAQVM